jgi:hypothetical protein
MVTDPPSSLVTLSGPHKEALNWFAARAGEEIEWPKPLNNGLYLLNKAKGIHKPKNWTHALSVRQAINSPYPDKEIVFQDDGSWEFEYFQEGDDPTAWQKDFTNVALMQNIANRVPVAVVRQTKLKPNPLYHVMGLAVVTGWRNGYFTLQSLDAEPTRPTVAEPSPPIDLNDARRRMEKAIVVREGAGAFRAKALKAFKGQCAVTGCKVTDVLEAAHIVPYLGTHTNGIGNTLLLRSDIHTLFDKGLLSIDDKNLTAKIEKSLKPTEYGYLQGKAINLPKGDLGFWRASLKLRSELLKMSAVASPKTESI